MTGITRRAVLRGGGSLGLAALTATAVVRGAAPAAAAGAAGARTKAGAAGHLLADYRPSMPTGLPPLPGQSDGMTLGGHTASRDFTYRGRPHRMSLLSFGRPGDAPDPVYEEVPGDPELRFRETVDTAWGEYYTFRYAGGLRRGDRFRVQSYGVVVQEPTADSPVTVCGGGMYVVCERDRRRGDPPLGDDWHWIQVIGMYGALGRPAEVDAGASNPFYAYGGLTPVNGEDVFNYYDMPQIAFDGMEDVDTRCLAETFLAQDTGRTDRSGKGIVNVFGGVKYGWQLAELRP